MRDAQTRDRSSACILAVAQNKRPKIYILSESCDIASGGRSAGIAPASLALGVRNGSRLRDRKWNCWKVMFVVSVYGNIASAVCLCAIEKLICGNWSSGLRSFGASIFEIFWEYYLCVDCNTIISNMGFPLQQQKATIWLRTKWIRKIDRPSASHKRRSIYDDGDSKVAHLHQTDIYMYKCSSLYFRSPQTRAHWNSHTHYGRK